VVSILSHLRLKWQRILLQFSLLSVHQCEVIFASIFRLNRSNCKSAIHSFLELDRNYIINNPRLHDERGRIHNVCVDRSSARCYHIATNCISVFMMACPRCSCAPINFSFFNVAFARIRKIFFKLTINFDKKFIFFLAIQNYLAIIFFTRKERSLKI